VKTRESARWWIILILTGVLTGLGGAAQAQTLGDTEHDAQLWPDVQVSFNLRNRWSVFLFGTMRLGRDWAAVTNEQIGVGVTKRLGNNLTMAASYRHLHTEAIPERHVNEDRLFGDVTPRFNLRKRLVLVDRNRFEWRKVNGDFMYRYRNRIQIERPIAVREKTLTPYTSFEAFYDSRFRAWSRFQSYSGMRIPLTKNVTFDGFYMHQWDSRAVPGYIDVVGALWRIEF
jgi:hypothetical protein